MSFGNQSPVKVTLRDPLNHSRKIVYSIIPEDNQLAQDWKTALTEILKKQLHLEKNFCFLGFPHTARTVEYLCDRLNEFITWINYFNTQTDWKAAGLDPYWIEEYFCEDSVRYKNNAALGKNQYRIKQDIFNRIHNHFEVLQGTVWNPSPYYKHANWLTKYAIRQLNLLCHELESLILSQRKLALDPMWVRPSQITTFVHAARYALTDQHREGFVQNGYDRVLGGVYMHWTQIGKTLYEVFRDESAPSLNIGNDPTDITLGAGTTCEAITALKFYSGEFDIEWGRSIVRGGPNPWHDAEQARFEQWMIDNGIDIKNPALSLGYLKIGQVDLQSSFGTDEPVDIWQQLGGHLDIYSIEVNGVIGVFDYTWSDPDHDSLQIQNLKRNEHGMD